MSAETIKREIRALLTERNAILLAHNYMRDEVQEIADITGDSLALSMEAAKTAADVIVFCGVHFMAESASILSPDKTVLLPRLDAGCPMSDMVTAEGLLDLTRTVFQMLDIVRVYAKRPGQPPDMKEPFTLPRGSSVSDLALRIHRNLADKLKTARVWNSPVCHDGQNIPREHVVNDKEVIELHFA